jgi:hypothetical protein
MLPRLSYVYPNILLYTPFSDTPSLCSTFNVKPDVSVTRHEGP